VEIGFWFEARWEKVTRRTCLKSKRTGGYGSSVRALKTQVSKINSQYWKKYSCKLFGAFQNKSNVNFMTNISGEKMFAY
jgi:hypothetical protein